MRADRKSQPSREPFAPQDLYMCTSFVRSAFFFPSLLSARRCYMHFGVCFFSKPPLFKSDSDEYEIVRSAYGKNACPCVLGGRVLFRE